MDGLLLALGIVAALALVLAPLFLAWPQHTRWLVTAQTLDRTSQLHPSLQLREVGIASATASWERRRALRGRTGRARA